MTGGRNKLTRIGVWQLDFDGRNWHRWLEHNAHLSVRTRPSAARARLTRQSPQPVFSLASIALCTAAHTVSSPGYDPHTSPSRWRKCAWAVLSRATCRGQRGTRSRVTGTVGVREDLEVYRVVVNRGGS